MKDRTGGEGTYRAGGGTNKVCMHVVYARVAGVGLIPLAADDEIKSRRAVRFLHPS